jgi:ubiquinone biosynthesis protein
LGRLRRITRIVAKHGFEELLNRGPGPAGADAATQHRGQQGPERFRRMLEELGPTFIKFGQIISSRPDLISRAYIEELKTLQDNCEPIPFTEIQDAIELALDAPLGECFLEIDPDPVATASIAQVHRGRVKSGQPVAIKVRRPGIEEQIPGDIDVLYRIARILEVVVEESRMTEPIRLVREFERALGEEMNFRNEALNLSLFRELHAHRPDIVVPAVFPEASTASVLTMSWLAGTPLSRLGPDADRHAVARRIVTEAFDEVFIDGVVHGDPHPGNLMVLQDGRYGVLDLGLVVRLSPAMRETLVVLALAIAVRDADTAARTIYRLGQPDERVDIAALRNDLTEVFEQYLGHSIGDLKSSAMLTDLLSRAMKHHIRIPPEYMMLCRAGATIEGIVREFHPEMDVAELTRPYAEKLLVSRVAPEKVQQGLYRTLLQFQGLSQEVPIQLSQILSDLSSGRFSVSVGGRQMEQLNASILMAATLVSGAMLAAAFVVGAFLGLAKIPGKMFGIPVVGVFGGAAAAVLFVWIGAYAWIRPRVRRISILRYLSKRKKR